jgi:hypothetical protein
VTRPSDPLGVTAERILEHPPGLAAIAKLFITNGPGE